MVGAVKGASVSGSGSRPRGDFADASLQYMHKEFDSRRVWAVE